METADQEAMDNEQADPAAPVDEPAPPTPASRHEARLRKLAGRKGVYRGPLLGVTRGWVSRDGRYHAFAARFLDFAVLTPEHLVLCSTGFFTRRPRRCVFRENLSRLEVVGLGADPMRSVRIVGNFSRPIRIELRDNDANHAFVQELLTRTHPTLPDPPAHDAANEVAAAAGPGAESTAAGVDGGSPAA